jgi:hypothetical protein
MTQSNVRPSRKVGIAAAAMVPIAALVAGFAEKLGLMEAGDGFKPRVETVDEFAGLVIGAFFVDRLVTFAWPTLARRNPAERDADLDVVRVGWGALFGAVFVMATDLRAVAALSEGTQIGAGWDRAIAVLAIATGLAGLARIQSALNPKVTDGNRKGTTTLMTRSPETEVEVQAVPTEEVQAVPSQEVQAGASTPPPATPALPPPAPIAYVVGIAGVVLALVASIVIVGAQDDKTGLDLKGLAEQANATGTVDVIIRFGPVLVAAVIVEQMLEKLLAPYIPSHNKPLIIGGVATFVSVLFARWGFDLYLLHNVGFFGVDGTEAFNDAIADSQEKDSARLWFDAFATGVVIAAGTKTLHDLSDRLRKPKEEATATASTAAAAAAAARPPSPPPPNGS